MAIAERALVIGWDGAGWPLVDPLLAAGRLPHLAALIERGFAAPLRSTIPPVTPAAWTSMACGLNPGRTGVLGFRHLDLDRPSAFDPTLASSADLQGRTLFEHAAALGEPVSLAGWPMTWPPLPLPGGVVLAGWPRPRTEVAPTWPATLGRRLGPWGDGDPTPRWGEASAEQEIAAAAWYDRRHTEIACGWLRERTDALAAVVLPGTDHLAHLLWDEPRLAQHYERADDHLGALVDAAGPNTAVLLVSDHGFGPAPTRRVHLDRWLFQGGWQRLAVESRGGRSLVGAAASAVRHGLPDRAWGELRDRLPPRLRRWAYERSAPQAAVDLSRTVATRVELYESSVGVRVADPGRCEGLLDALRAEPWVERAWTREELFSGPFLTTRVPHLIVELDPDVGAGSSVGEGAVVEAVPPEELVAWPATHRRTGIAVGAGPGIGSQPPTDAGVEDVIATALALVGVPLPDDLDGRVWTESIDATPTFVERGPQGGGGGRGPSDPSLERSLRKLGYLRST